jgi:hypothetical protein
MKKIILFGGKYALVDDDDFELVSKYKWHVTYKGYAETSIYLGGGRKNRKVKKLKMHRVILEKHNLIQEDLETDHINRNKLDNRKSNLRMVTNQLNQLNTGLRKDNTSGYKGVHWDKLNKKWRAQINYNGKKIGLGYFQTAKEASGSYKEAINRYYATK